METQNYYKDTCALYNRAYNVISMEEYEYLYSISTEFQ